MLIIDMGLKWAMLITDMGAELQNVNLYKEQNLQVNVHLQERGLDCKFWHSNEKRANKKDTFGKQMLKTMPKIFHKLCKSSQKS